MLHGMAVDVEVQHASRDPAQPTYVFRGHTAHVHSVRILHRNTCLLTGDADGWVVYWKLETKRPLAVWKAHDSAILGTAEWGPNNIITHGRDNALRIWQVKPQDASYSTVLPADGADTHRPNPWLLHSLPVNTLNFCAFSMCYRKTGVVTQSGRGALGTSPTSPSEPIYIAVPGRDDQKIELYQFPDEKMICVVPRIKTTDTGMVMAVKLVHHEPTNNILVVAGYEGGFTAVHLVPRKPASIRGATPDLTQMIYFSRPHTQPVLSVDALPDGSKYFTSSADAIIAAHRIPELPSNTGTESDANDNAIEAANEGSRFHAEFSNTDLNGPGIPIHQGLATSAVAENAAETNPATSAPSDIDAPPDPLDFAKQPTPAPPKSSQPSNRPSGLSSLLASLPPQEKVKPPVRIPTITAPQPPHKILNTKHSGQQSLRVRSDGRLLATGGWDSRVRIYSAKTLKEVAVLKWHKEGVYAVDFGGVLSEGNGGRDTSGGRSEKDGDGDGNAVAKKETGLGRLQRQREEAMQSKHWIVAGAKDGKVSLWEVF